MNACVGNEDDAIAGGAKADAQIGIEAANKVLALAPHLLKQGSGHIVYVSSMDARTGLPLDAPYVAAKAAMSGLTEVLRQELHGTGVSVTTVFPGRVDTPMIDSLEVPWISAKIGPEVVARATLRAIVRKKPQAIIPLQAHVLDYLGAFFPRLSDWMVRLFHLEGRETGTGGRPQPPETPSPPMSL